MSKDFIDWHLVESKSSTLLSLLKEAWRYQLPVEDSNKAEEANPPLMNPDLPETLIVMQKYLTKFLQPTPMEWPLLVSFGIPYVRDLRGLNHMQSRKHFIGETFLDLLLSHMSYYIHQYAPYNEEGSHIENYHYLADLSIIVYQNHFLKQIDSKFYLDNEAKWSLIYLEPRNRDQCK